MIQQPKNRSERRLIERERKRIEQHIGWIEKAFIIMLWDESNGLSYRELYVHYLDEWRRYSDSFNLHKQRGILIDEYYFANKFQPLEKEV